MCSLSAMRERSVTEAARPMAAYSCNATTWLEAEWLRRVVVVVKTQTEETVLQLG